MFKNGFEFIQQVLTLAKDMAETKEQVKTLQGQVNSLIAGLQAVQSEIEFAKREAAQDKENLILRLQNVLLKSGIDLSPSGESSAPKVEHKRRQ